MGESEYYVQVFVPDYFSFEDGGHWGGIGESESDLEKVLELYRQAKVFYVKVRIMKQTSDVDVTSLVTA